MTAVSNHATAPVDAPSDKHQHLDRERLELAVTIAKLGTFEWHVPSGRVHLDERAREIYGFAADRQITADDVFARIHPDDRGWVQELTSESVRLGRSMDVEYRLLLPANEMRHISSSGQMLRGPQGETEQVLGVFADVTDRVRADEALRDSEARFRTIANAMPHMLWSTRSDGFHDYYNKRWYEYTGVPAGSTDGDAWNGMFHPEDQPRAWERWQRSLRTGEAYEIEYRLRHRSGEYRWVLGRALPIRNDAGEITRWMGTCTDVHDQKTARDELTNLNERKDEFLAMLAHELRNPLAPITSAAYLLKAGRIDAARIERSAEIILRQARHLTSLVNDLLDVSRVSRGLVELRKGPVDLKAVLAHAVEQCRPLLDARGHELALRSTAGPAIVLGDESRLVQIVANVLTNAAKYTPAEGRISLVLKVEQGTASIEVSDSGIGIESELLPHIFELFIQGRRTPDRSQGGLGLGLALVKNLVELHGGDISASSEGPGRGSTFRIDLPVHAPAQAAADIDANRHATSAPELSILLVDDNADAVETLALLLGDQGHKVAAVTNVDAALEITAREHFDVLILDIGLPKMNGHELARRIRLQPAAHGSMFVALSGYGQQADIEASRLAGFHHHFVKPLDVGALMETLARSAAEPVPAQGPAKGA